MYSLGYPKERRGETACWGHYFNSLIVFFYYYSTVEINIGPMDYAKASKTGGRDPQ